jgi:prepilin-type processing-associated H-X9-DG protein
MYCPKCGALNPDYAKLCSVCGQTMMTVAPQVSDGATIGPRVSGWATTALVLGIASPFTCMLTALPAVIVGIVALVKIGNSNGRLKGLGMAIAGMALPVVLLPLTAIGMGILMPALARTRQLAFRMTCGTNLVGLGKAMQVYAGDYDGRFPTPEKWCDLLTQYTGVSPAAFRCKGAAEGPCNYAMNRAAAVLGARAPANMVLLFETSPGWNQVGGPEILTTENHFGDGCNILFVDGHIEFVKPALLEQLQWTPDEPVRSNRLSTGLQRAPPL